MPAPGPHGYAGTFVECDAHGEPSGYVTNCFCLIAFHGGSRAEALAGYVRHSKPQLVAEATGCAVRSWPGWHGPDEWSDAEWIDVLRALGPIAASPPEAKLP